MIRESLLKELRTYLMNFSSDAEIARQTNSSEFSVQVSEVLRDILSIVLDMNFSEVKKKLKTFVGVDCMDKSGGCAVAIILSPDNDVIKLTIERFLNSVYRKNINKLYFYILTKKEATLSQVVINRLVAGRLDFDVGQHVMDHTDISRLLKIKDKEYAVIAVNKLLKDKFAVHHIGKELSETEYNSFKSTYQKACLNNFSRINFPGLPKINSEAVEIQLSQIFVRASFRYLEEGINEFNGSINNPNTSGSIRAFSSLFCNYKHLVVLGNPGIGKSLMIQSVMLNIIKLERKEFKNQDIFNYLPFRIELRKYSEFKKHQRKGLQDYIVQLLEIQYNTSITKNILFELFKSTKSIVFFDGLDEVFDIEDRIQIRNDIENFVNLFKNVRTIVTSRFESYQEVRFKFETFKLAELLNFDPDQQVEYINKWYSIEETDISIRKQSIISFLKEIRQIDDELKYNPLLLALILLIYKSNGKTVPTTRFEIFEGCTHTLVVFWDELVKKLARGEVFEKVIPILSDLGYWQFNKECNQEPVDNQKVRQQIKSFLISRSDVYKDDDFDIVVHNFLSFAKLRSIYLDREFTHKTFMEYFASNYIYNRYRKKVKDDNYLERLLQNHIGKASWQTVLELLICKFDNTQDLSLGVIIDEQLKINKEKATIFFLQTLKHLKNLNYKFITVLINSGIELSAIGIESAFDELITVYNMSALQQRVRDSFLQMFSSSTTPGELLFIHEFAICGGDVDLIGALDNPGLATDDHYLFLLRNYKMLLQDSTYLCLIIELKADQTEKRSMLYTQYYSKSKKKIFFGSGQLNLLLSFILKNDVSEWERAYGLLIDHGIEFDDITMSVKEPLPLVNFSREDLDSVMKRSSYVEFKSFVKLVRSLLS